MARKPYASRKKTITWNAVRGHLAGWDEPALLALLKDIYALSESNRHFLLARCGAEESVGASVENYRQEIIEQFFPEDGEDGLSLTVAKKAIRDYRMATGNLAGTAELLLTYVECGVKYTYMYGDIDQQFYSSIESVLGDLAEMLCDDVPECYSRFRARLVCLPKKTSGIGWGFHEFMRDTVAELESELGDKDG